MEAEVSRRENPEGADRPEVSDGPSSLKEWARLRAEELQRQGEAIEAQANLVTEATEHWIDEVRKFAYEVGQGTETLKQVRRYVDLAQQQFKTYRIGPESILGQLLDRAKDAADAELEVPE